MRVFRALLVFAAIGGVVCEPGQEAHAEVAKDPLADVAKDMPAGDGGPGDSLVAVLTGMLTSFAKDRDTDVAAMQTIWDLCGHYSTPAEKKLKALQDKIVELKQREAEDEKKEKGAEVPKSLKDRIAEKMAEIEDIKGSLNPIDEVMGIVEPGRKKFHEFLTEHHEALGKTDAAKKGAFLELQSTLRAGHRARSSRRAVRRSAAPAKVSIDPKEKTAALDRLMDLITTTQADMKASHSKVDAEIMELKEKKKAELKKAVAELAKLQDVESGKIDLASATVDDLQLTTKDIKMLEGQLPKLEGAVQGEVNFCTLYKAEYDERMKNRAVVKGLVKKLITWITNASMFIKKKLETKCCPCSEDKCPAGRQRCPNCDDKDGQKKKDEEAKLALDDADNTAELEKQLEAAAKKESPVLAKIDESIKTDQAAVEEAEKQSDKATEEAQAPSPSPSP